MQDPPRTTFLCPVTIGRTAEMHAIRAFLNEPGGVLLVSGEAGVGKSRLVGEARAIAAAADLRVLEGRCFEADAALPFAAAVALLHALVDAHGPAAIARLAPPAAADLFRLLPELSPDRMPEGPGGVDPETAKRRLLDGFARLLAAIADGQPLLLIVEDIHWPDASSLDLLLHLARRATREPLLLLATYRSDEIHPALEHALATLDRERLAREIHLDGLGAHEVAAMLQAIFGVAEPAPAELLHTIYALTEGNPFFIEEVLTALGAEHRFVSAEGAWSRGGLPHPRIPRSVHDAVRRRLGALSAEARDILVLAAIAGRRFDLDLLRVLSGHDDGTLIALVKELIAAQLVVEEAGDRFAFRHALTRDAISAGLLDRERRLLHRRIGDALATLHAAAPEARLDDLSAHYFAAGAWAQACDAARRAGMRASALHAPRAAAEHLTRAEEARRALGLPPDPEIHHTRGRAYETLGEFDRARADFEIALDLARSGGDRRGEWQSLLDLSLLWASRDYRQTGKLVGEALAVARAMGDPATVAHSLNRLGNWHDNVEETKEGARLHQEALAIFEAIGDDPGTAETLDLLGMNGLQGANVAASAAAYERAAALWRTLGDRRGLAAALLGLSLRSPTFHTDTIPAVRPVNDIRAIGQESIAVCREIDWRAGECFALWGFLGMTLGAAGEYDVALPGTRHALQIAREIEHRQWITAARCILGNLYADLGDPGVARRELEAALALARQIESPYWTRSAAGWLAAVLIRAGDPTAAASLLHNELNAETPMDTIAGRLLWCAAAELAHARGEPERALEIVERLVAATPGGASRPIARLEKLRGEALAALGRHEHAEAALTTAREEAAWSGARPLLWRIDAALGRLHLRQGERAAAERAFANARGMVDSLAACVPEEAARETFRAAAHRELPLAAPSPGAPAPDKESPLTKRELQVAALLTAGLTNREIGERLFLSEWTVATHVRHILVKLDLSSRAQIAAWATSRGMTPEP